MQLYFQKLVKMISVLKAFLNAALIYFSLYILYKKPLTLMFGFIIECYVTISTTDHQEWSVISHK